MIKGWEDYYKILQVHFMAEPEIIKSAYLRLSKKYHPDVNPSASAEEKMKAINQAYEILSDPVSRKHYLVKWMENYSMFHTARQTENQIHPLDFSVEPGKKVMLAYLKCLSKGSYNEAFQLLSDHDKENIAIEDFIKWQKLVAEVFELIRFECDLLTIHTDFTLKGCSFETVVELKVKVYENNRLMGRYEEDEFQKCVVLEKGNWHVFLGYAELSTIIKRFNELANLKNKPRSTLDSAPGAMVRKEFQEKAAYEQIRFNRYGNPFSLIFCIIDLSGYALGDRAGIIKEVGGIITANIRNLDRCCVWQADTYAILLPETDQGAARKTANKIKRAIQEQAENCSIDFAVVQQRHTSLEDLINRMQQTNDSFRAALKND